MEGYDPNDQAVPLIRYSTGLSPLKTQHDALVIIVADMIMHARFECMNAVGHETFAAYLRGRQEMLNGCFGSASSYGAISALGNGFFVHQRMPGYESRVPSVAAQKV